MTHSDWDGVGARWWKFDFHAHTPASCDYGRGPDQAALKSRAPEKWLLDYMRAEIDCVAVTDHNTGVWVDKLKEALQVLCTTRPEGYRPLHLFPGVEISVSGGIHVLAILDASRSSSDIDRLLGAVDYGGAPGACDGATRKSISDVVEEIVRAGGLAIPAHVDGANGLFERLAGTTLEGVLRDGGIRAMEVLDPRAPRPGVYGSVKPGWTEVVGSDAHHPGPSAGGGGNYPGSRFTWVKMGEPSLNGLRLALLDGAAFSIRRSDVVADDPNAHAGQVIECVEVADARYMGRGQPFSVQFSPWLNAVIGGRGTGKSTLVEFMRLAFRREGELPKDLLDDWQKYSEASTGREETGLLTDRARIRVVYRKEGARFRVQWSPDGVVEPIEKHTGDGWVPAAGEVRQRFPVRIYSQKQIYHLALDRVALVKVIDDALGDKYRELKGCLDAKANQYLALRGRMREIEARLAEEARLRGELDDVERKLGVFDASGHADVLKRLQRRRRQMEALEAWESELQQMAATLHSTAETLAPEVIEDPDFDAEAEEDAEILALAADSAARARRIAEEVKALAARADALVDEWGRSKAESRWQVAADQAVHAYERLRERLSSEGVTELSDYGPLVQRRRLLEQQLKDLDGLRAGLAEREKDAQRCLGDIETARRGITRAREGFLKEVVGENRYVRISVAAFGSKETVEAEFREILGRASGEFAKDIGSPDDGGGLLGALYAGGITAASLRELKRRVRAIAEDPEGEKVEDKRFATHLGSLASRTPEALDRLDVWFPEDGLDVSYSASGGGTAFRSIQEGSPGQKTAALLAFILSYGDEPLMLDQPEDDLDNSLISDLIVRQLREAKRRRQVIVVTHNANIVVNGDAELVVALTADGGQTRARVRGCLQDLRVREAVCEVLEGGSEAFRQRYHRIAPEVRRV